MGRLDKTKEEGKNKRGMEEEQRRQGGGRRGGVRKQRREEAKQRACMRALSNGFVDGY